MSISEESPADLATHVLVDWGTTSFRLWLVDARGAVIAESRGSDGMMQAAETGFEAVLARHLETVNAPRHLPILICGMAGARQGWVEAPYAPVPADLSNLTDRTVDVPTGLGAVRILPGVSQPSPESPDVMRGEETQLLGLAAGGTSGLVCMPGTHCKWVELENGAIQRFSTFLTGELFDVLARHSILKHAVDLETRPSEAHEVFLASMRLSLADPGGAWGRIFALRAGQLLGFTERTDGASQLSGLLIGAEVGAALRRHPGHETVTLIAAGPLAVLYGATLDEAGLRVRLVDAEEATRRGLLQAARHIWPDAPKERMLS